MTLKQLKQTLITAIKESLKKQPYYTETVQINLEVPKDETNGDFSTNIAMQYARYAKKSPRDVAADIIETLDITGCNVKETTIAGPGFINFFIDKTFLLKTIAIINEQQTYYGSSPKKTDERLNIEFVSVNPTGALHVGHARGAAAGDALCRILTKAGYNVTKEYYVNDAGNQITNLAKSIEARYKQLFDIKIDIPEDGYHGKEIIEVAEKIKEQENDSYLTGDHLSFFKEYGVTYLLDNLKRDLKRFNVKFDVWFSEQTLYDEELVSKTVATLKEAGYTYEEDGATWLKTSLYEDEKDRVIIKSDGTYTYLTPDIAYHKNKLDRGFTKLIDILGGDHHGYIDRLQAAIRMVGGKEDALEVEILQMVKVLQDGKEVKMSKRSGKAITLIDLLDEVGKDPIRFFFAARSLNTQMDLDLDLAIRQTNENPVYYTQYAHARIHSIFDKAQEEGYKITDLPNTFSTIKSKQAFDLITELANYPEIISIASDKREPHKLTNYIIALASAFHTYYNAEQIVVDDKQHTLERLALLNAVRIVLKDALSLIGVSAPIHM
ncbi:MAG: arginine--tRNA ligase [Candidatus Izimaplasma sp.]|nr:arginine--tRNA ligase [Candidatus Izimaplasma bacterium]